jgi:hypothetical protein
MPPLDPALYGPEGNQYINDTNFVLIDVPAGFATIIEFEIPTNNEFAIDAYNEIAAAGQPNAEQLFERGNYDRSKDVFVLDPQQRVKFVVTGWYKEGGGPNWKKPWLQARNGVKQTATSVTGGVLMIQHEFWFADTDPIQFKAAHVVVTLSGPA